MARVLIVYYSRNGNTAAMARRVARGVEEIDGCEALLRSVAPLVADGRSVAELPDDGPPYARIEDLRSCDALILGSPTRFGNMAAPLKQFIDSTGPEWLSGVLVGKPGAAFTSTGSLHGGQEATLLSMMIPLLHHGMVLVGLPYTEPDLMGTDSGGTPYGPSHRAGVDADRPLTDAEKRLCQALGRRVANLARRLS